MVKSSKVSANKVWLPKDAMKADEAIRQQADRVKERIEKMKEAEALSKDGHHAEAEKLMAEARGEDKPFSKTKKANGTSLRTKENAKSPKRPERHDGKDVSYPKTAEDGLAHAEAVREKVKQCPPAKASGIKTTSEVKNPKSEVKMKRKQSVTKITKETKRKPASKKTSAKKAPTKKTPTKKTKRGTVTVGGRALDDFNNNQKITINKNARKEAGDASKLRYAVLKSGMTVEKAISAMSDGGFKGRRGWLRRERKAGRITIK